MNTTNLSYQRRLRIPVYRGLLHFLAAHFRVALHSFFRMGMRDVMNREIVSGDRVFDLDYHFHDRDRSDKANFGLVFEDTTSITGLSVEWGNTEISMITDPSRLLKRNV